MEIGTKKSNKKMFQGIITLLIFFFSSGAFSSDGYVRGGEFKSYLNENEIYFKEIQPILDRRCVVCHSCTEAPCQLKLTSPEMIQRGANKHTFVGTVFGSRPRADKMIDLKSQREGGFYSVTEMETSNNTSNHNSAKDSVLSLLIKQGHKNSLDSLPSLLPKQEYVDPEDRICVSSTSDFNDLSSADQRKLGMPYYAAPLKKEEYQYLSQWVDNGAPLPAQNVLDQRLIPSNPKIISAWESFFNDKAWKAKWTSRYLYEHLFTAHFYFDELPGEFYELVRSKTASPNKVIQVPSNRPFEKPEGVDHFYYRLKKIDSTIVHKQHLVYSVNLKELSWLKEMFWNTNWSSSPAEKPFDFSNRNPFVAFEHIPANSRYRWMLKNAKMILEMAMRSDNCHGEGSTSALRDSALYMFVKPESDVSVRYPDYFKEANPYLEMVNADADNMAENLLLYTRYESNQESYSKIKQKYQRALLGKGLHFEDIWDGEGGKQLPLFTVLRHEKTASVHDGAWGPQQRVSWLFDYVTFERLYYNCVALEFLPDIILNKFGAVIYLRTIGREVEQQMLSLIQEGFRKIILNDWIQAEGTKHRFDDSAFSTDFNSKILHLPGYRVDFKAPFISMMNYLIFTSGRFSPQIVGTNQYSLVTNNPTFENFKRLSYYMSEPQKNKNGQLDSNGNRAQYFPNVSYIIIKKSNGTSEYYTMVANRYYDYVNYQPLNTDPDDRLGRNAKKDWLTFFPGIQINYPGKIYVTDEASLQGFMNDLRQVSDSLMYSQFDIRYGLQKTSNRFWDTIDEIQTYFINQNRIFNGSIDLSEYGAHDLLGTP